MEESHRRQQLFSRLRGLDPHAVIVEHHGRLLSAQWAPYRIDQPTLVYSASKTFTSLAIGCLIDAGQVELDADVSAYLQVTNPYHFTIRDLLSMRTGHSDAQLETMPFEVEAFFATKPELPRGTFAYNSQASFVLGAVVRAVTGTDLTGYLRPRILEPLGITACWWGHEGEVEQGYSGFHVSAEDLSKAGQLLLQRGTWNGKQLVSASYISELQQVQVATVSKENPTERAGEINDWAYGYGLQVWRSRHGFRLDGAFGQFALIVPEADLVISYLGATNDAQPTLNALWGYAQPLLEGRNVSKAGEGAGGAVVQLDSWDYRSDYGRTEKCSEVENWTLTPGLPGSGDGWTLHTHGAMSGSVAVGRDEWAHTVLPATPDGHGDRRVFAVDARGEETGNGVLIHCVFATSPHRLIIDADAEHARGWWHTVPLHNGGVGALAVSPEIL